MTKEPVFMTHHKVRFKDLEKFLNVVRILYVDSFWINITNYGIVFIR